MKNKTPVDIVNNYKTEYIEKPHDPNDRWYRDDTYQHNDIVGFEKSNSEYGEFYIDIDLQKHIF